MIDIRLPSITGTTEREQLVQVKSYLHQLAEQLQWALQNVDTSNNTVVVTPTPRSLAPSSGNASGEINAQATFASIKSLIIKSAEIVDAYYEEIDKKLVGLYVAKSDFGEYVDATEAKIDANSKDITTTFTNIQTVDGKVDAVAEEARTKLHEAKEGILGNVDSLAEDVDEKTKALDEAIKTTNVVVATVTGTIKTGELYKDEKGLPVYGLEIGQRTTVNDVETFDKYARFTSDRLSFYDKNGAEVAYFSDNKLYITQAEITGTLDLGGYRIETSNGLAFKWVGGN